MQILKFILYYIFCFFFICVEGYTENESHIFGLKPKDCKIYEISDFIPVVYTKRNSMLYVFGNHLSPDTEIGFTKQQNCKYQFPAELTLSDEMGKLGYRGEVYFNPPSTQSAWTKTKYYVCLKEKNDTVWRFQGSGKHVSIYTYEPLFTSAWFFIALIIICYMISSLMTGLNLGLMTLDTNELKLLRKAGSTKEKKYASKIIPVRRNGNFLVCSLVITATLCNAVSTVVTDEFVSNVYTVVISTAIIVLCCEILPQSICSAFPLTVGARTIYITRTCMFLTSPISYPLSKLLDCVVGKELTETYTKERLRELLKKTHLPTHEERIISGTLDFSSKKVEEVMTVLDDSFKLPITAVMDFETIAAILASGFSRIPIYVGDKSNIQYVLLTKDLALLNPEDKVPVEVLVQNMKSTCQYVSKGTSLEKVLGKFKDSRHHMLFVTEDENIMDKKKTIGRVIGLVTFEDLVEEIFQMEIVDETDTISDNRGKKRISLIQNTDLISLLLKPSKTNAPSENLKLAAYHFLSEVDEFGLKHVSSTVLISLLNLDIFYTTSGKKLPQDVLYGRGVPANYFVMILEGHMEVKIGKEELTFEAGAFRHFGVEVLRGISPFTPDYTLQGVKRSLYLKITKELYTAALLATRFERFKEVPNISHKSEVYKYFTQIVGTDVTRKQTK